MVNILQKYNFIVYLNVLLNRKIKSGHFNNTSKNAHPHYGITCPDSNVYQMPQANMPSIRFRLFKEPSDVLPETTAKN